MARDKGRGITFGLGHPATHGPNYFLKQKQANTMQSITYNFSAANYTPQVQQEYWFSLRKTKIQSNQIHKQVTGSTCSTLRCCRHALGGPTRCCSSCGPSAKSFCAPQNISRANAKRPKPPREPMPNGPSRRGACRRTPRDVSGTSRPRHFRCRRFGSDASPRRSPSACAEKSPKKK